MSVVIVADWDADGVVSAAELLYAQEKLGVFPVRGKVHVDLVPSGPRGFKDKVSGKCWEYVIVIDIPFTDDVDSGLKSMVDSGCKFKLYYFDHHKSTSENIEHIERTYGGIVVSGSTSTSLIIKNFLEKLGIKITPRLKLFIEAVTAIEGGKRTSASEGVVKLVIAISKHLNRTKSPDIWCKYVRWLADPIPFDEIELLLGKETPGLVDESLRVSKEADEELRDIAMSFAMSARKIGYLRFIDARGKWSGRGASALASAVHKIVGEPVVLLTDRSDGITLVIIRSSRGEAGRLIDMLYALGLVEDRGGHSNIAVGKLSKNVSLKDLELNLLRLSLYMR
ncbi:MAG: phosphoesterase [Thermoprotei archaeon]|nr:phosphoesterase [Thermoprotei archaeon]